MWQKRTSPARTIAVIGNYLPRQCGIATFTTDLCEALAAAAPTAEIFAVALNDRPEGYDYPERVRFTIGQHDLLDYHRAAEYLNLSDIDLVCVQHEYGIFGGTAGDHVLSLLRDLRAPIVTTLHTVLEHPDADQRRVMLELARLSASLVVMSAKGEELLRTVYDLPAEKIVFIPHGIPDVPFVDPNFYKDQFGVDGHTTLLTFGLLSPGKGIETVIEALPAILERHPDAVYMLLGATHPHVKARDGEQYRESLKRRAAELGVSEQVRFFDQFVELDELVRFIGATDVYVTPYLNPAQITSGTLAYTVGAGKAVVSTPYWYAEELLADGRGRLVPFRDPQALAETVNDMLDHDAERHAMRKRAYQFGRAMVWPAVAARYFETFDAARTLGKVYRVPRLRAELPQLNLSHIQRMTDDTGLLEHARFSLPNYAEGYCTDDNARALLLTTLLEESEDPLAAQLAPRYLAFLDYAFDPQTGAFRNDMRFDRTWETHRVSADAHGRAVWALGTLLGRSDDPALLGVASRMFNAALPETLRSHHLRPGAYALLGLAAYAQRFGGDQRVRHVIAQLTDRLYAAYSATSGPDWQWFEDHLAYDNAVLPHALLLGGHILGRTDQIDAALTALGWLERLQQSEAGSFRPVGSYGFAHRGGPMAAFDQQPLEAGSLVLACLDAHRITTATRWRTAADRAFAWFLGKNDLGQPVYNARTGGCRDGLLADRVNQNEGAESTLAFLLALTQLRQTEQVAAPQRAPRVNAAARRAA